MLTGNLLRVRLMRNRVAPQYLDSLDAGWLAVAERLLEMFRGREGRTRGGLEEDVKESFGAAQQQQVYQGLAKLLEDRCEFEVIAGLPPEQIREAVFTSAAQRRVRDRTAQPRHSFDRNVVLQEVGTQLGLTADAVDQGLFADLKSEQRLVAFKDITAQRLLERYNVALVQAVLLKSTGVHVLIRGEPPQRFRQLLRLVKFHRLVCDVQARGSDAFDLHLDGPLSLFSATQKYGLQLALFLPAVLRCRDYEVEAELRWGPQRTSKVFRLEPKEGLVSHYQDHGMYVPTELSMFVELFRKKIIDWEIQEGPEIVRLGQGYWVPDFKLVERASGRGVLLEVLGFWRRSSVSQHLARLKEHIKEPFLLAVSDQLRVDEAELEGLPAEVHRFKQMPLPDEIARLARALVS